MIKLGQVSFLFIMFVYENSQIPTLKFTKAELVYALAVLLNDLPPTDNSTELELVELRFYLNRIRERVRAACVDGTLERAMPMQKELKPKQAAKKPTPSIPKIEDLRRQFPNLTDEELNEAIGKMREAAEKAAVEQANADDNINEAMEKVVKGPRQREVDSGQLSSEEETQKSMDAKKFAMLLGSY